MKKKKMVSMNFLVIICFSMFLSIINIENVNAKTNSDVTTRELAMLASLVYEDVPNDYIYADNTGKGNGCVDAKGNLKNQNCFYTFDDSTTYRLKGLTTQKVHKYIEGMSERKVRSIVSFATSTFEEPGEKYYFLNFAHTKEMQEKGWTIFDYQSQDTLKLIPEKIQKMFPDAVNFKGIFDAVTFKRGDNYVIAYRGTDFPDLQEWIDNVLYAVSGKHKEAELAYFYAQTVYDKIIEVTPNAKIYVTGHSLGGYLAQVGGAAIVDKEAGKTYKKGEFNFISKNYSNYNELTNDYKNPEQSRLVQVGYFNGMGVGGLFGISSKITRQVQNALVYLGTHDRNGNYISDNNAAKVNYAKNINSSGRLVLYSMDGDPVSSIGLHFGEIYKLEVGADAITNHREKHGKGVGFLGEAIQSAAQWYYTKKEEYDKFIEKVNEKVRNILLINSANQLDKLINDLDNVGASGLDAIPDLVKNQISLENPNVTLNKFNLFALLENLTNDVSGFGERYGIKNLYDHFNANHETDSFVCLMDSVIYDDGSRRINGDIEKIDVKVYSVGDIEKFRKDGLDATSNKCNNGVCKLTKKYDDKGFIFDHKTVTENYIGEQNNIVLVAKVDNACAKEYTWYYSTSENGQYAVLGTTTDNKIIIPKSLYGNNDVSKTYYFKVSATYGDTYAPVKAKYYENRKIIEYVKEGAYSGNPTLNDGINDALVAKASTTSKATKVSLTIDTTAPTCKVKNSTENVKLSCKLFGSLCTDKTVYPELVCTDTGTGVNKSTLKLDIKAKEVGLIPSIKVAKADAGTSNITNGISRKIGVTATRVPTSKTPYIKVSGEVYDNAGNKATINTQVYFNIKK